MVSKSLKTQLSKTVLASAALLALMPSQVMAQKVPVFHPGPWEVGSTQLASVRGLKPMKLPCIISTEYDNGYTVRFSGGGNSLLAMAIDFRQEVFTQGRKYNAMVSVGDSYVKQVTASAFTNSTLIFNLRPLKDFYGTVKTGKQMEIDIEGNAMQFNLDEIAASFAGLEKCYAGGEAAPVKPMVSEANADTKMPPAQVPKVEKIAAAPLPRSFDEIVQNSDKQSAAPTPMRVAQPKPAPAAAAAPAPAPAPVAAQPAANPAPRAPEPVTPAPAQVSKRIDTAQWTARSGEDIKTVLSRWSDRAGYDLDWQSNESGKVAQDVSLNGSFEDAVSQLLAENSAATGISGRLETDQGTKTVGNAAEWKAAPGSSLQSVLDQWAAKAGVAVVWETSVNAPVKTPVSDNGSFESAVQSLLDQYESDSARPVGRLNTDPQTGQKTLYMQMERS